MLPKIEKNVGIAQSRDARISCYVRVNRVPSLCVVILYLSCLINQTSVLPFSHSMVGRARGGVRGKGGGGPSPNKPGARGGLRASFVPSTNNSHLDTRQNNGQWKSPMLQEQNLRLTCEVRIHSITLFFE